MVEVSLICDCGVQECAHIQDHRILQRQIADLARKSPSALPLTTRSPIMVEVCAICDIEGCVHIRERERLRGFPGQATRFDMAEATKALQADTPATAALRVQIADLRAMIDAQAKLIAMMEKAGK